MSDHDTPMKILWVSNSPMTSSGYGVQTALFRQRIHDAGHLITVFGVFGHHGATMNDGVGAILPVGRDAWGNDMLAGHVAQLQPDVVVSLLDIWIMQPENVGYLTAWAPVDHDPIPPRVKAPLLECRHTWAMSRFAERQMRAVGLTPDYVPHGVDTRVYTPMDRAQARAVWQVPEGKFLAVMVAANRGYPPRKSFDRVLKAWGQFVQSHPDALLYLHTEPDTTDGIDLVECAQFYGIPDDNVRFPDLYRLRRGDYGSGRMNALYNAADVLLAPSMGEGFGIPVVEAQAAGCPVVVSDFSAQSELVGPGYLIPVDDDDHFYSLQASEYALIRPSEIRKGIEWAYEQRGDSALRAASRSFALDYDAQRVFDSFMLPALVRQVERERDQAALRQARTRTRLAGRGVDHVHQWAYTGLYIDGKLHVPCNTPGCACALVDDRIVEGVFPDTVNGVKLDLLDDPEGGVVKIVLRELVDSYGLDALTLAPGDVVLDVGAQVGAVSIYLAKQQPDARIYAFEPVPANFARLEANLARNGVTNVTPIQLAVTGDGRELTLHTAPSVNSGGASAFSSPNGHHETVPSVTLNAFLRTHRIERVRLLKLDCEGAEYEIVDALAEWLPRIDSVRGEAHVNQRLLDAGHSPEKLIAALAAVPDVKLTTTRMSE